MKERPILFSAPMVRAILDGTKTQTRRVMKRQPSEHHWQCLPGYELKQSQMVTIDGSAAVKLSHSIPQNREWDAATSWVNCTYGKPGDRLWVRESLGYCCEYGHYYAADRTFLCSIFDDEDKQTGYSYECAMREASVPSIHLPRKWSRITLEVTGVRVERLQDISVADARAEGAKPTDPCDHVRRSCGEIGCEGPTEYRAGYCQLWEQINGAGSWAANPWVWVVEFKRVEGGAA